MLGENRNQHHKGADVVVGSEACNRPSAVGSSAEPEAISGSPSDRGL